MPNELGPKKLKIRSVIRVPGEKPRLWDRVSNATKIATGVGVGALLLFGVPALVPVAVSVAGVAGWQAYKRRKCMTPERRKIYEQALASLKDPKKLRTLADEFEKGGCVAEAEHLRRRAKLRERSPEEAKADRLRYREAMKSKDASHVGREASYFSQIGADASAANLRTRMTALKAVA